MHLRFVPLAPARYESPMKVNGKHTRTIWLESDGRSVGIIDQTRLRDIFRELDRRGSKLMLSNSDAPFIRELYKGYQIDEVSAARAVSCDPSKRGAVTEVVVRNYR